MQGKVVAGQYVNDKFIAAINKAIFDLLKNENMGTESSAYDLFWWPCQ